MTRELLRQHLIDPEVCIRCNTCEEACPTKAISHDKRNYVVAPELCDACGNCLPPCPTGAIDSWRRVERPFPLVEQLAWDTLPGDAEPANDARMGVVPADVAAIAAAATSSMGPSPPPWSAAHPYIGLYARERPAVATVAGNHRLTDEDAESDIRHIVLDFGKTAFPVLEGQSLGIIPPGVDADGRPHHARLYSVASPRDGERPRHNNLAITVKRVMMDRDGAPVRGVASNYLCDLARGDTVNVTGPYGASFLMPNHPAAKLLMICTGTGSAPMRAMTERRRRRMGRPDQGGEGGAGKILLFFGARRPGELPYFGPLQKLPSSLIDVELAFSRVPDAPKEYVQDRMRRRGEAVADLLADEESFVYVCGHKRMEEGVMAALTDIGAQHGFVWADLRARLLREGRLHVETY